MQNEPTKRFDIPTTGKTKLEIYRAMRSFFEKKAQENGKELDPSWYKDGPEDMPELYDQPIKSPLT